MSDREHRLPAELVGGRRVLVSSAELPDGAADSLGPDAAVWLGR